MNPLLQLREAGQGVWLDFLRRSLITGGGLERLVREDHLLRLLPCHRGSPLSRIARPAAARPDPGSVSGRAAVGLTPAVHWKGFDAARSHEESKVRNMRLHARDSSS
jgi:hypothetical protein